MTTIVKKYRLYCNTEAQNVEVWSETTPTACPNNNTHSIDSNSVSIIETVSTNKVESIPDNIYSKQMDAVSKTFVKNTTTTVDFKVDNLAGESYSVKYLWGGELILDGNEVFGDHAQFSVIDIDNVMGYGAGVTLKTYVIKMFVEPNYKMVCKPLAPGAVPCGCYLRCTYTSTGTVNDVKGLVNYDVNTKED